MTELVSTGRIDLSYVDIVIVHVGTNNIASNQSVDTILAYYGDLLHKIKAKTDAFVVFTSILPRLIDHSKTSEKINQVNSRLRKFCHRKNILFSNLHRSFLVENRPDPTLFAPRDGLHLNFAGTELLRKIYQHY